MPEELGGGAPGGRACLGRQAHAAKEYLPEPESTSKGGTSDTAEHGRRDGRQETNLPPYLGGRHSLRTGLTAQFGQLLLLLILLLLQLFPYIKVRYANV